MPEAAFTHLVASREGLYVAGIAGCERRRDGLYFGATIRDGVQRGAARPGERQGHHPEP